MIGDFQRVRESAIQWVKRAPRGHDSAGRSMQKARTDRGGRK